MLAGIHVKAAFYWNCNYFATGVAYDIRNGHYATVHGAATFKRSPIDSGFNLKVRKLTISG
jgi:hypothetical protein